MPNYLTLTFEHFMPTQITLRILPKNFNDSYIKTAIAKQIDLSKIDFFEYSILKKSTDARQLPIKYQLSILVHTNESISSYVKNDKKYAKVDKKKKVHIIGAGPAGLFAALKVIEKGCKPIVYERGRNVKDRRRDLAQLTKKHIVNPESNYCFGEGGAGTYSDGKLYTRSKKRGSVTEILNTFVAFGADENILYEAHPHIGTNKLPSIISAITNKIIECGGEVLFNSKLKDIYIKENKIEALLLNNERVEVDNVILATGHSARDVYEMFYAKGLALDYKQFAVGVRIEHPQTLIDKIQYRCESRGEFLEPAAYQLVAQVEGGKFKKKRGVYSFCMCPGGIIAPCATNQEEVVTNGWSPSKRNNKYANSGIVVSIEDDDLRKFSKFGPLAGMKFQASLERKAWEMAGKTQVAPAQRMIDFIENRKSETLPENSYMAGVKSVNLNEVFPESIAHYLRNGLLAFGKKKKGYLTNEAILVGVETRSSAPVRIPRDKETLEHIEVAGLYPCAEGAGYAGGIVSAAIDGMRCAEKIVEKMAIT